MNPLNGGMADIPRDSDEKERAGLRHSPQQSTHLFNVARACCLNDRSCSQKQKSLELWRG